MGRDIWDYIVENIRLSFGVWRTANRIGAVIGALAALAIAALVAVGWTVTGTELGKSLLTVLPGTFLLVLFFVVTPYRMWAQQKRQIEGLTSKPKRMSFVDFAALAEADYGWSLGNDSYQSLDFVRALRQAVCDEFFAIEGLRGCMNMPEHMKDAYVLERIPSDHLKDFQIVVPGFFRGTRNYEISTSTFDAADVDRFRDLHIADKHRAILWLKDRAECWKGRAEAAAQLEAQGRARWEADMREQGYEAIGDRDSEEGQRWVKRTATDVDTGA